MTLALATLNPARADPLLADFDYPHPIQGYEFQSQGQSLSMAYMDVRPAQPNGKTVVLLHGKIMPVNGSPNTIAGRAPLSARRPC